MLCFVERRDLEKGPEEMPQEGVLGEGRVGLLIGSGDWLEVFYMFSFLPPPD